MHFVAVKSEAQQAILALHSMRDGLIETRTAQLHRNSPTKAVLLKPSEVESM